VEAQAVYTNILLPTDGSELSQRAVRHGIQLAKALNARVIGLSVVISSHVPTGSGTAILGDHVLQDAAQEFLSFVAHEAKEQGVPCACFYVTGDSAHEEIIAAAVSKDCDLIVMGSHGRSAVGKLLLGSEAAAVVAGCQVPVLLCR